MKSLTIIERTNPVYLKKFGNLDFPQDNLKISVTSISPKKVQNNQEIRKIKLNSENPEVLTIGMFRENSENSENPE